MFRRELTVGRVFRGMVAGMIGGAAGSWMMNHLDEFSRAKAAGRTPSQPQRPQATAATAAQATGSEPQRHKQEGAGGGLEPTVRVAEAISRELFDHPLTAREQQIAGPAVHYGYRTLVGGLYGALAEVWPNAKIGFGMGYGIAVWALTDEALLPALRLSPPPTRTPIPKHADTLAAHVCYGLTLDFVRRVAKILL